jgi:predicted 3-demethylubiquinone-9 3-methyltransferase (glyoxalase superfamily)
MTMQKITTFLTFNNRGQEAVEFYIAVFKDSVLHTSMVMPGSTQLIHANFSLNGQDFMAMDGGELFSFALGTSLFIYCEDQAEVDYYWQALSADGGEPGQCGWLKDKFGMSWQVVPKQLGELMQNPDQAKATAVMQAMRDMKKIEIAGLQSAAEQA